MLCRGRNIVAYYRVGEYLPIIHNTKILAVLFLLLVPTYLLASEPLTPQTNTDPIKLVGEPEIVVEEVVEEKEEVKEVSDDVRCNCYAYVKKYYHSDLPSTRVILSNLTEEISDVAVFYYPSSGVNHYAKVVRVEGDYIIIDEANFSRCKVGVRKIAMSDPFLLGFYNPS